jgi:hypothetical protein
MQKVGRSTSLLVGICLCLGGSKGLDENAALSEEGTLKISVDGKEIGTEKYSLAVVGDSVKSSCLLDFRNPANTRQRVRLESKLEMDPQFRPREYRLQSDVDGKKGTIVGTFSPNEVMLEYGHGDNPRKTGLLVGKDFTILDTNIFHHFIFLARLFKFDNPQSTQRFEVVIPQAADTGVLKASELEMEALKLGGKKMECYHLLLDSGALTVHLWVDKQRILRKIAIPGLSLEVTRENR